MCLRLAQLIDAHNAAHPDAQLSKENIYVLEKAREIGQHCLSGALARPALHARTASGISKKKRRSMPKSVKEAVYFLTEKSKFKFPITPPFLRDHGNYVISLNRFVKWLGSKVEETGITIFTGFAGSELLFEGDRVIGVRTDDKGVDKEGQQKSNFEPGYDLQAKVVILAEGPRGSLTKQLIQKFDLAKDANPQTYGVGMKELWEVPAGRIAPGEVIYTMGWPLTTKEYGGAWIYGSKDNVVSLGFVTGLDYADPRLDPQRVLQQFKRHPFVAKLLEGGKMIRYGAKSMPYGGWWAIPPVAGNGWMILGDSAGFVNSARLKGIHLAIKSGMLAAETAFEALKKDDSSAATLGAVSEESRIQLDQRRALESPQPAPGIRARHVRRHVPHRPADDHRRARPAQPLSRESRIRAHAEAVRVAGRWRRRSSAARSRQGRWQADVRQAHRPLSLGHEARRRSAGASGHPRHERLQRALREGIRQPLPEFLSGERLRDGRRRQPAERQAHQPESIELRALQDLRHR